MGGEDVFRSPYHPITPSPTTLVSLLAEVGLTHHVVAEELATSAGEDDLAGLDHVASAGHRQGFEGILLDQEHGRALAIDVLDNLEDRVNQNRRETKRRLV